MKKLIVHSGAAFLLALLITGCASDGTTARVQEKSAAYANLQLWQKTFINKGDIAVGFTPDMVYMALGHASDVKRENDAGGGATELWTYNNYYPPFDSTYPRYAPYTTETPYQPSDTQGTMGDFNGGTVASGSKEVPRGMGGTNQSLATTGGPQGGTIEPADLQAYKLVVLFQHGKVVRFGLKLI